ncbi:MAG TPA: hypothetical protein VGI03_11170 [Verrucomicrobiae bacterium]
MSDPPAKTSLAQRTAGDEQTAIAHFLNQREFFGKWQGGKSFAALPFAGQNFSHQFAHSFPRYLSNS